MSGAAATEVPAVSHARRPLLVSRSPNRPAGGGPRPHMPCSSRSIDAAHAQHTASQNMPGQRRTAAVRRKRMLLPAEPASHAARLAGAPEPMPPTMPPMQMPPAIRGACSGEAGAGPQVCAASAAGQPGGPGRAHPC